MESRSLILAKGASKVRTSHEKADTIPWNFTIESPCYYEKANVILKKVDATWNPYNHEKVDKIFQDRDL